MGYERYNRGQRDPRDISADDRDTYSSARDYQAAGEIDRGYDNRSSGYYGRDESDDRGPGWGRYGRRDYGRPEYGGRQDYGRGNYDRSEGGRSNDRYAAYGDQGYRQSEPYAGSYASDGHRFADVDDQGGQPRRDYGRGYGRPDSTRGGYGRQPQGYNYQERGFLNRAGDEVRSWFGDEDAERRRDADARFDQRHDADRDTDYGSWRRGQIAALDRDYDEYRQENRSKFENEFSSWRTERQTQRSSLTSVAEHMEVVGSDGSHVGTVDNVRGDRIILTKNDEDAHGRHHSIPSRWIETVDDKVTLRKTADQAQAEWRDEERNQALFGEGRDRDQRARTIGDDAGGHILNRSFSGTY